MTTKQVTKDTTELGNELKKRLKGEVKFDRMTRALYATDASIFQMDPIGVVFPVDVEDVVNTVTFAASEGIPVLPRGGGTGLAGQTVNHALTGSNKDRELFYKRVGKLKEGPQVQINQNINLTYAIQTVQPVEPSKQPEKGLNDLVPYIPKPK